jgi:hypothetical protein
VTPSTDHVLGGPLARATHHGNPDPIAAPVFSRWRGEGVELSPTGRFLLALLIAVTVWGVAAIFHPLQGPVLAGGALVGFLSYWLLEHVHRRRPSH